MAVLVDKNHTRTAIWISICGRAVAHFWSMRKSTLPCLIACVCFGIGPLTATGQDGFSTMGGDASGSTGSEAFSVGLVVYTELSGPGGSMSQGIQHPYEVFPVAVAEQDGAFQASVYPNPVEGILYMETGTLADNASYQLFDAGWKELLQQSITAPLSRLDLTQLPAGVYLLRLNQGNNHTRSFTIVKH